MPPKSDSSPASVTREDARKRASHRARARAKLVADTEAVARHYNAAKQNISGALPHLARSLAMYKFLHEQIDAMYGARLVDFIDTVAVIKNQISGLESVDLEDAARQLDQDSDLKREISEVKSGLSPLPLLSTYTTERFELPASSLQERHFTRHAALG